MVGPHSDHRLFFFYNLYNLSSAGPTIPLQEHWMTWTWNLYTKVQECLVLRRQIGREKPALDAESNRPELESPPYLSLTVDY